MIRVLVSTDDNHIKEISFTEMKKGNYKWAWVDFSEPNEEEIKELEDYFHFHPLAIEDCIHFLQRPKLDYYDDFTFFVLHSFNQKGVNKTELDFFVNNGLIVSFHKDPSDEISQVWNKVMSNTKHVNDPFDILHKIIDTIVDQYFPVLYRIEDELNEIDSHTPENMHQLLDRLFDTREELLQLRHTINPMRDLLYRMLNSSHLDWITNKRVYFSDIYDHLLKLSEMVDSNREITADIRDSYLSLNSHLTNKNMMVLTVITTIFMPITFIVGLYGMNFEYMPELSYRYGYFIVLGVMALITILMYRWFKRRGWFNQ